MAERERERSVEIGTDRERGNYLIEENFDRKGFEFFLDFVAFSL